jgi:hypothetical protein
LFDLWVYPVFGELLSEVTVPLGLDAVLPKQGIPECAWGNGPWTKELLPYSLVDLGPVLLGVVL